MRVASCWTVGLMLVCGVAPCAGPALAGDGIIEINQVCAVQTGCFPGDVSGFPVTITQSGSYRLTGGLTVPDANTTAVEFSSSVSQVTLDLGGFTILGPNEISSYTVCSDPGSGIGIHAPDVQLKNLGIVVRNGSVVGMGSHGLYLLSGASRIENVLARENCGYGIRNDGDGGMIFDCHARENLSTGIQAASRVRDCWASNNGGSGIEVTGSAAIVSGCVSRENAAGIVFGNFTSGVAVENVVTGNRGDAFKGGPVTLVHNTMTGNTGSAFVGDVRSGIGENTYFGNPGGGATGAPIGCNVFDGTLTCPSHP